MFEVVSGFNRKIVLSYSMKDADCVVFEKEFCFECLVDFVDFIGVILVWLFVLDIRDIDEAKEGVARLCGAAQVAL